MPATSTAGWQHTGQLPPGRYDLLPVQRADDSDVKMSGCFGKPTVRVEPGKLYQVSITGMGTVRVQEVSRIRPPKETGHWGSLF